jgi:hypothetical protein
VLAADDQQKQAKADLACTYSELGYAEANTGELTKGLADEQKALAFYDTLGAAKSSNVFLLHDYAEALMRIGESCLLNPNRDSLRQGKAFLQRALNILQLMRDRRTLAAADNSRIIEARAELTQLGRRLLLAR